MMKSVTFKRLRGAGLRLGIQKCISLRRVALDYDDCNSGNM